MLQVTERISPLVYFGISAGHFHIMDREGSVKGGDLHGFLALQDRSSAEELDTQGRGSRASNATVTAPL